MAKVCQVCSESDPRFLGALVPLWRYTSIERLLFCLSGKIFVPSVARLRNSDPFEGEFYFDIAHFNLARRKFFGAADEDVCRWIEKHLCSESERSGVKLNAGHPDYRAKIQQRHLLDFLRKTRFAWCWFKSSESALMWSCYGKGGVAVKSAAGRIRKALEGTGWDWEFGEMSYVNFVEGQPPLGIDANDPKDEHLLLRPHFLKRIEYRDEHEVRFVTSGPPEVDLVIDLPPEKWIAEICLAPTTSRDEEESLKAVFEQLAPDIPCNKSRMLERRPCLRDLMKRDSDRSADHAWKSGSDGIPLALKSLKPPT